MLDVNFEKKLDNFNLSVKFQSDMEILAVYGPSGAGKSMMLKCIAGLEKIDNGYVRVDNNTFFDSQKSIDIAPQYRRVGYLFQSYALFNNMTVLDNIIIAIRRDEEKLQHRSFKERLFKKQEKEIAYEMLEKLNIGSLAKKYTYEISGGEQQRVALARIFVNKPSVLLLDEPFSALDDFTKQKAQNELLETINSFCGSVVLSSHSKEEIYSMSKRMICIKNGQISSPKPTKDLILGPLDNPNEIFSRAFI